MSLLRRKSSCSIVLENAEIAELLRAGEKIPPELGISVHNRPFGVNF